MGACATGQAPATIHPGDCPGVRYPPEHRPQIRSGQDPAFGAHQQHIVVSGGISLNGHFRWTSTQGSERDRVLGKIQLADSLQGSISEDDSSRGAVLPPISFSAASAASCMACATSSSITSLRGCRYRKTTSLTGMPVTVLTAWA